MLFAENCKTKNLPPNPGASGSRSLVTRKGPRRAQSPDTNDPGRPWATM